MPRKRHTPAEILAKLKQAESELAAGRAPGAVAEALNVSEQTLRRWQRDFGADEQAVQLRLRRLEQDNLKLRRVLSELEHDKQALVEALQGNF